MSPEDRSRFRPLVASSLSPHVVKARADEVDALIGRVLPRLVDAPPRPILRDLSLDIMTRLLTGLPDGDADETAFLRAVGDCRWDTGGSSVAAAPSGASRKRWK